MRRPLAVIMFLFASAIVSHGAEPENPQQNGSAFSFESIKTFVKDWAPITTPMIALAVDAGTGGAIPKEVTSSLLMAGGVAFTYDQFVHKPAINKLDGTVTSLNQTVQALENNLDILKMESAKNHTTAAKVISGLQKENNNLQKNLKLALDKLEALVPKLTVLENEKKTQAEHIQKLTNAMIVQWLVVLLLALVVFWQYFRAMVLCRTIQMPKVMVPGANLSASRSRRPSLVFGPNRWFTRSRKKTGSYSTARHGMELFCSTMSVSFVILRFLKTIQEHMIRFWGLGILANFLWTAQVRSIRPGSLLNKWLFTSGSPVLSLPTDTFARKTYPFISAGSFKDCLESYYFISLDLLCLFFWRVASYPALLERDIPWRRLFASPLSSIPLTNLGYTIVTLKFLQEFPYSEWQTLPMKSHCKWATRIYVRLSGDLSNIDIGKYLERLNLPYQQLDKIEIWVDHESQYEDALAWVDVAAKDSKAKTRGTLKRELRRVLTGL